jgi:hypothetical protein
MPLEEFFRTVVFGADTAREARRNANTAPMNSADYWREEFDGPWSEHAEPTLAPFGQNAPQAAGPLPGTLPGKQANDPLLSAVPNPGGPLLLELPNLLRTSARAARPSAGDATTQKSAPSAPASSETTTHQNIPQPSQNATTTAPTPDAAPSKDLPILNGGILDAGKLFLHYLGGSEEELEMDFNDVDTSGVTPEQFPGFQQQVDALRAAGGGTTTISLSKTYSTKGAQHAALGHITLKLEGKLTVGKNGWHLDGELESGPDKYDFNKMEPGERSRAAEFSTQLGGLMGSMFNPKEFRIHINGKKTIKGRGTW